MLVLLIACSPEKTNDSAAAPESIQVEAPSGLFPDATGCSSSIEPVLALHGFLAGGDSFINIERRLMEKGLCPDHFLTLDWNTFNEDQSEVLLEVDLYVEELLSRSGSDKITLIGHSAGGGLGLSYQAIPEYASKVGHYIHIGSFPEANPETIPMLNLYSAADTVVSESATVDQPHVTNVDLEIEDHYEVATSESSFNAIASFLALPEESSDEYEEAQFWGKAIYFGENLPVKNAPITIQPLEEGIAIEEHPSITASSNDEGLFGPLPLVRNTYYEICLQAQEGPETCHYLMPQEKPTQQLRLRALPDEGFASALLSGLPLESEESMTLVSFSRATAMIAGRDSYLMGETELLTEARANADETLIALFHYDNNEDLTAGEDPSLFGAFPFLGAVDQPLERTGAPIELSYNGNQLWIPRAMSSVQIAILETP